MFKKRERGGERKEKKRTKGKKRKLIKNPKGLPSHPECKVHSENYLTSHLALGTEEILSINSC